MHRSLVESAAKCGGRSHVCIGSIFEDIINKEWLVSYIGHMVARSVIE